MTNRRRRMQTRRRRIGFDVPYANWPEVHNEGVALRKHLRGLNKSILRIQRALFPLRAAFMQVAAAANDAGAVIDAFNETQQETSDDQR